MLHPVRRQRAEFEKKRKREMEADEAASKRIRKKEYVKKGQLEKKWAKQSSKSAGVGDD